MDSGLTGSMSSEIVQLLLIRAGPRYDEFSALLEATGPVACTACGRGYPWRIADRNVLSLQWSSIICMCPISRLSCLPQVVLDQAVTNLVSERVITTVRARSLLPALALLQFFGEMCPRLISKKP